MAGAQPEAGQLQRMVDSFTADNRPEVLMMTGGEPLLRPDLVASLATSARRAGTRSAVLTGAFFAGEYRVPQRIARAIRAVDHFSVSMDAFHEREVPREAVFAVLRTIMDAGVGVSVHAAGNGSRDPYLADLVAATRRAFGDRLPMLVNTVRPVGRAASWAGARRVEQDLGRVLPCAMAAWPVVAHDGAVLACCNQDVVDRRPVPAHLALGHVASDDWATVRARALSSPMLRMIRVVGPTHLVKRYGAGADAAGYCAACRELAAYPQVTEAVQRIAAGAAGELLDRQAARMQQDAGPVAFVRRYGCAQYADLVA